MKKKLKNFLCATLAGFFNGAFGAGGGVFVVLVLKKIGLKPKKAHATATLIVCLLSVFSLIIYFFICKFNFFDVLIFLPFGILGSVVGSVFLKKIETNILRRIFGIILIIASVRLLF